jgi:beta-glucosidase
MKKLKPLAMWKNIVIWVVSAVLIIALSIGNYFANIYENLITVFFSENNYSVTEEEMKKCQEVEAEGAVLLKNDGILPLAGNEKVALFGQNSVDFVYGGAGSGSVDSSKMPSLKDSMEKAGFTVNSTLWDFYLTGAGENYRKTFPDITGSGKFFVNEVPAEIYTDSVKNSLTDDVAIVSLGRGGGESSDLPTGTESTDKYTSIGYKYLEADKNELDMIKLACSKFQKVILIVNSSNAMELGFLDLPEYANVKAALWVGAVGQNGIMAIGELLSGKVNPSGRLADTYAYDSESAPSFTNFGSYNLTGTGNDTKAKYYMNYAEGIYVGYKYYETRYEDYVLEQGNAGDYDYSETVQFPFGYGLSYSDFEWSDFTVTPAADGKSFDISLKVANKSKNLAGKDVVEIYMQSPYTEYDKTNKVEKSAIELVGYAKTSLIDAGGEETVTLNISKEMLKAYDYTEAKTYIVDAGTYYFTAGRNAHDALNNVLTAKGADSSKLTANGNAELVATYEQSVIDTTTYAVSQATGKAITNQFDDVNINYYDTFTYLTRNDWAGTLPTAVFKNGNWEATERMKADLAYYRADEVINDGSATPTYESKTTNYTVKDLADADYSDSRWDDLVSQLSRTDMTRIVRLGGYSTIALDQIGLPGTQDKDGPSGISGTLVGGVSCMAWPVEVVFASTWNDKLIEEVGEMIGQESIEAGVAGWYAPGANIHRSPYSGRNFEYFSEDGVLSGKIGAAEMRGVRSYGVIAYMKHFALNDQETNRGGGAIFANEQAIREIYLRSFEYISREGKAIAAMVSMNRIGARWVGAHKGLITETLRNEWGFKGVVITDQASTTSMYYQDMISGLWAGTDLWLNTNSQYWSLLKYPEYDGSTVDYTKNATVMKYAHNAAKNVIYAVANSNAVKEYSGNAANGNNDGTPTWKIYLIVLNVVVYAACAFGLIFPTTLLVLDKIKKNKQTEEEQAATFGNTKD